MVDTGAFIVQLDPRMRSQRRTFRILHQSGFRTRDAAHAVAVTDAPTRLKDGELPGHDDWDCIADAIAAGLLEGNFEPGEKLELTNAGRAAINALREHKSNGGNYHQFTWEQGAA